MTDMRLFLFPEAGTLPGIPGVFSGQAVTLAPDGSITVLPLARHPHFAPASEQAQQEAETTKVEEDL